MSDRTPTRIFFQLAELPEDRDAPNYKALCQRQVDFQNRLTAAGVSQFFYAQPGLFNPEVRWAEIPYGDPIEPVMRVFCEGVRVGEYISFTDPRPRGLSAKTVTYTRKNVESYT